MAELPPTTFRPRGQKKEKEEEKRKTGRSGLHASPRQELPDIHGYQEVHIAISHISRENSSDTCARRHRPAFQPIANDFALVIGIGLLLPALLFSL